VRFDRRTGPLLSQGLVGGQDPLEGLVGARGSLCIRWLSGVRVVLAEPATEGLMDLRVGGTRRDAEFGVRVGLG